MGNEKSSDDFSNNPNFDMAAHQRAMQQINSNYGQNIDLRMPQSNLRKPNTEQTHLRQIQRSCYIFKNTIQIRCEPDLFIVNFEYDSSYGNQLEVYAGIIDIKQDQNQITTLIDSKLRYQEHLLPGKKVKFHKEYSLQGYQGLLANGVIIVMRTPNEVSEYSLRHVGQGQWKVLLEKLQMQGRVTQLVNIYKGEAQNNDCIICLSAEANTLIEPCNHLCLCGDCLQPVRNSTNKCPICRTAIMHFKTILPN